MLANLVQEQTNRFIAYARENNLIIGSTIQLYHGGHHMDRTGNLLNSLCWGVSYNNTLMGSGFYRPESIHSYHSWAEGDTSESFLHEFYPDVKYAYPIHGRQLAEKYIQMHGWKSGGNHWRMWFAILAPYWGYWEQGFTMKSNFGGGSKRLRFQVMSQTCDRMRRELSPAKVPPLQVHVESYSIASLNARQKKYSEGKLTKL